MSDGWIAQLAVTLDCPRCGSTSGIDCTTPQLRPRRVPHRERLLAAQNRHSRSVAILEAERRGTPMSDKPTTPAGAPACNVKCSHGKFCISKNHKMRRPHNTGCCLVSFIRREEQP